MANINIDPNAMVPRYSVMGATVPPEGPRTLAVGLDFTQASQYSLDLQNLQQRNFFSMLQGLFVDNSQNPASLTINFPNTGQNLIFEAGTQAYITTLCQNPAKLVFISSGDVSAVVVYLLNYPVTNDVWNANAALAAAEVVTYSGGVTHPALVANLTKTASLTNTSGTLITGAPGYYITGISLQLTSDAALTAGTDLQVTITDSSAGSVATLNLSPANGLFGAILGLFWNNKTANSTLVLTFSTSLSAGHLYYTINYGQSTFVG